MRFPPWREECLLPSFRRDLLSEYVGVFFLLFITLGCVVFNNDGVISPAHAVRLSLLNGGTTAVLVFSLSSVSAIFNPAVCLALALTGRISPFKALACSAVQCVAAACGAGLVRAMTPALFDAAGGGANQLSTSASLAEGLAVEFACTFVLVMVVMAANDEAAARRSPHLSTLAPLVVGLAVASANFVAIPVTACSINPARTWGVALVSGNWDSHWIFWAGPCLGGVAATLVYHTLRGEGA